YAHWVYQLNALVGNDIALYRLFETDMDCHARFSAVERTYHYYIHVTKNPFIAESSHFVRQPLDMEAMRAAAALLVGRRDFSAFEKLHGADSSHICDLRRAEIRDLGDGRYCFVFSADRFLRNMVRAMVGTLLAVGQGRFAVADVPAILDGRDRCQAGESVPGHALFLQEVRYPAW
ncbi:MAG: tRNA pseudouridine(38-40) synthase TruA, partial [Bacteroidales bacterium]|nr:tRNA pseudouridine(38-40) synthase TruA [Bacteroidales bacterium]